MAQPSAHLLASSPRLHCSQSEEMLGRRQVRRRVLRVAATSALVLVAARTLSATRLHRRP